jgi:hypothetical protein
VSPFRILVHFSRCASPRATAFLARRKVKCRELKALQHAGFDEAETASYALKRTAREDGQLDVDLQRLRDLSTNQRFNTGSRKALLCKLFSCSDTLILSFALHPKCPDEVSF